MVRQLFLSVPLTAPLLLSKAGKDTTVHPRQVVHQRGEKKNSGPKSFQTRLLFCTLPAEEEEQQPQLSSTPGPPPPSPPGVGEGGGGGVAGGGDLIFSRID